MRTRPYLVFDPHGKRRQRRGGLGPSATPGSAGWTLAVEELSVAEVARQRTLGRDVAPLVPMRLIEPVAMASAVRPAAPGASWGVRAVGGDASPFTGAGIRVAILDTGIDAAHEAFREVQITRRNFTTGPDDDVNGHGTHCAGTIAGTDVNGFRFGVAVGIDELLVAKVLGPGAGTNAALTDAMMWAYSEGAHIISMSLGFDFPGLVTALVADGLEIEPATSLALESYRDVIGLFGKIARFIADEEAAQNVRAALVVAATGNESRRGGLDPYTIGAAPPAASEGFVRVGALAKTGIADFSNTGATVVAPGVEIFSAKPGNQYALASGTSMATPHVAGVAALWAEKLMSGRGLTLRDLRARLAGTAQPMYDLPLIEIGSGLVRAPAE